MESVLGIILLVMILIFILKEINNDGVGPAKEPHRQRRDPPQVDKLEQQYHQGYYEVVNPEKYRGDIDNIFFRSDWERKAFVYCDLSNRVIAWASEEIVVPYYMKGSRRPHRYYPDLMIYYENKETVMVEIKPKHEKLEPSIQNKCKWAAARTYCRKRGWQFRIWTEDTIDKFS